MHRRHLCQAMFFAEQYAECLLVCDSSDCVCRRHNANFSLAETSGSWYGKLNTELSTTLNALLKYVLFLRESMPFTEGVSVMSPKNATRIILGTKEMVYCHCPGEARQERCTNAFHLGVIISLTQLLP